MPSRICVILGKYATCGDEREKRRGFPMALREIPQRLRGLRLRNATPRALQVGRFSLSRRTILSAICLQIGQRAARRRANRRGLRNARDPPRKEKEALAAFPAPMPNMLHTEWRALYRWGARAALAVLALMPVQIVVYTLWPPPVTVAEWFALFNRSAVIGLISMDLLLGVDYLLMALFFLALWACVSDVSPAVASVALLAEMLGVSIYFDSAGALEMLTLGAAYTESLTNERRAALAAAGESVLVAWQGTAFAVSYALGGVATLAMSAAMRRSILFTAPLAWVGVAAGTLNIVPPVFGSWSVWLSVASLLPTALWLYWTARVLLRLQRDGPHVCSAAA